MNTLMNWHLKIRLECTMIQFDISFIIILYFVILIFHFSLLQEFSYYNHNDYIYM